MTEPCFLLTSLRTLRVFHRKILSSVLEAETKGYWERQRHRDEAAAGIACAALAQQDTAGHLTARTCHKTHFCAKLETPNS